MRGVSLALLWEGCYRFVPRPGRSFEPADKGISVSMGRDIWANLFEDNLLDLSGETFGHFHVL